MGDVTLRSAARTDEQIDALAEYASIGEAMGVAELIRRYENGKDMTDILRRLLGVQEHKKRAGIEPFHMRSALKRANPQEALRSLRAQARVRHVLRAHTEARAH
jgi:hypothetical protein